LNTSIVVFASLVAAASASGQTHQRHAPAHDSAHAIVLSDADHVALHKLLLGRWTGQVAMHGSVPRDSMSFHFVDDSVHQRLRVRHTTGVADFVIRGDTLRWNQAVGGAACTVSAPVSALVQAAKAKRARAEVDGTLSCGSDMARLRLTKTGS
jgi:hypothetical protein